MSYASEMRMRLPTTMSMPEEFEALFDWIEAKGFFMPSTAFPGDRLAMLGPGKEPYEGTIILFRVETAEQAQKSGDAWSGVHVPDIANRLVLFARTGGDGSHAAFWIADDGQQHIVYVGSEGEAGILASRPLDFLRLLAIGYEYIDDCFERPDEPPENDAGSRVVINEAYRSWLRHSYGVTIPHTASEVIKEIPGGMPGKTQSNDPFFRWAYHWHFEPSEDPTRYSSWRG